MWPACLLLALSVLACSGGPPESAAESGAFDAERAFRDLVEQVRIGPRPAGSEASEKTRVLIRSRLRQAGWPVVDREFRAQKPDGESFRGANLIATLAGASAERIWLAAHYDTKALAGRHFVGANDGASGVAVLLELARVLGTRPRPFTVELVFFDGEEAFGNNITRSDGLYGSRALASQLAASGELLAIRALVLLDMVGDADLNLTPDRRSAAWLNRLLREAGSRQQPDPVDPQARVTLLDDHIPFRERGLVDVLAIIDFEFGARRTPGPLWHTERDDLSAVSPRSLNRVGQLVVELLERIETELAGRERAPAAPRDAGEQAGG